MQSKSAALRDQINELDARIQGAGNLSERNQLEADRNELNNQLQASLAEETQQRESLQAQAEQIGGLKEILQSIFEAAFPKDETVKLIGLTEYEATQETYNQLVDQAVDENQTLLYAAFQQQLEQRDEKFRLLTLQALDVQRQLEEAKSFENHQNDQILNQEKEIEVHLNTIQSLEEAAESREEYVKQIESEVMRLKDREFDLQQQIANVQTIPQVIDIIPTIASESLSERIAQAKVNSKLQLANVKAIGANWVEGINSEGNKEIAHVSAVEPVTEFPHIEPVSEVVETAENIPFQTNQVDANTNGENTANTGNGNTDEVVEQTESQVTLETLKAEVDAIKTYLGIAA